MEVHCWSHDLIDLADFPSELMKKDESVLANSVNVANYRFLQELKQSHKVLEVGCGCSSFLKDNMVNPRNWFGIDVYDYDNRGRKCIATHKASVHNTPFSEDTFDFVVSNQSIEHWTEYGVSLEAGFCEIWRILKVEGRAYFNFPFYLHGDPIFVRGELDKILEKLPKKLWEIKEIVAYKNSETCNYKGWRRCGFPDFYINKRGVVPSSFVVEIVIAKRNCEIKNFSLIQRRNANITVRKKSSLERAYRHGVGYVCWRFLSKLNSIINSQRSS